MKMVFEKTNKQTNKQKTRYVHLKALSFHYTFMYNLQNTNEMGSGLHISPCIKRNMERWVQFLCHVGPKFKVQKIVELM